MTCESYLRIADCPGAAWDSVVEQHGGVFMTREFIAATEEAFSDQVRFEHVIAYDRGRPVACGCFCSFPLDLDLLSDDRTRWLTRALRGLCPSALKAKVIFCGLPVSVGANQLALCPGERGGRALRLMHRTATAFARQEGARFIIFKEFSDEECRALAGLDGLKYRRFASPAFNAMDRGFHDFDAYCRSLRSRYRQCVRRSLKKGNLAGLSYRRLTGPEEIIGAYDPSLHRLYEAVALSSDHRLELLPISFFHALARRMAGRVGLTIAIIDGRIVAFDWNLLEGGRYSFLFAGLDYGLNAELDLYFNLMYAEMDFAFRTGAGSLWFGQTADDFKGRLGCTQHPRSFYVAPVGVAAELILRVAGARLFPERPSPPLFHVFATDEPSRTRTLEQESPI